MKHEQLLVQYGMVRASGLRTMELQTKLAETETKLKRLQDGREQTDRAQVLHSEQQSQELRQAHLELEGRALEIAALKEKVRGLEMLTRNARASDPIERQFRDLMTQSEKVERMQDHLRDAGPTAEPWTEGGEDEPDH